VLLDTGFSADDVANMRRQFYLSRGEEMPEGLDVGDVSTSISLSSNIPTDNLRRRARSSIRGTVDRRWFNSRYSYQYVPPSLAS
jgi:hypothetical protein